MIAMSNPERQAYIAQGRSQSTSSGFSCRSQLQKKSRASRLQRNDACEGSHWHADEPELMFPIREHSRTMDMRQVADSAADSKQPTPENVVDKIQLKATRRKRTNLVPHADIADAINLRK